MNKIFLEFNLHFIALILFKLELSKCRVPCIYVLRYIQSSINLCNEKKTIKLLLHTIIDQSNVYGELVITQPFGHKIMSPETQLFTLSTKYKGMART